MTSRFWQLFVTLVSTRRQCLRFPQLASCRQHLQPRLSPLLPCMFGHVGTSPVLGGSDWRVAAYAQNSVVTVLVQWSFGCQSSRLVGHPANQQNCCTSLNSCVLYSIYMAKNPKPTFWYSKPFTVCLKC